jgi:DnaJ family protein C protein 27
VHLWDLSGHAEYADVRNELYAGTDAVFLVYDVTQRRSFDSLDAWLREVQRYSGGPRAPVVAVVANKCDQKSKRVVPPAEGQKWAAVQKIR